MNKYNKVDAAVILASGKGERMQPLTFDTPKPLLKVNGEVLIERLIKQLKEKNINDIYVVVGYLKDKFEYLIEKYNVKLIYNDEYLNKNTLSSLYKVISSLKKKNFYIVYSDLYFINNLFNTEEICSNFKSIYIDKDNEEWPLIINEKGYISDIIKKGAKSYVMVGIAYFNKKDAEILFKFCEILYNEKYSDKLYWEEILLRYLRDFEPIKVEKIPKGLLFEFDDYETLKDFDKEIDTGCTSMQIIKKIFSVPEKDIIIRQIMANGITNYSFLFEINGLNGKFLMRVPGYGTDKFIDRKIETKILTQMQKLNITEDILYIDDNGYKISKYIEDCRTINVNNESDLKFAMSILKKLHKTDLYIENTKNLFDWVKMYETDVERLKLEFLYDDYEILKNKIHIMIDNLKLTSRKKGFCHGDANPTNILIKGDIYKFIDFEYTNIFDQAYEISMFALNCGFDHIKALELLKYYLDSDGDVNIFEGLQINEIEELILKYYAISEYYSYLWALVMQYNKGIDYVDYITDYHIKLLNVLKFIEEGKNKS